MEIIKPGTRFDFIGKARSFGTISIILVVVSWALVGIKGLNFGIDFAGGTEALVAFTEPIEPVELRKLTESVGLEKPEVVTYGITDEGRYFVRSRTQNLLTAEEISKTQKAVEAKIGKPSLWDASDEAGEEIRVRFAESEAAGDLRGKLAEALKEAGFEHADVTTQTLGGANPVYVLRMPTVRARLHAACTEAFEGRFKSIERIESVGSAVGRQMRNQGILAVFYALIGILLYISFRFDLRYSPGAVLALFHDISITVGMFSLLGLEFSLPIIAALLAIVGYSLNDTIVVYDRIRESVKEGRAKTLIENVNLSINECLSRTVLTSVTTLFAVAAIYIFGGGIIQNFAFAMMVGILVGTYSSIYVASPVVLIMDERRRQRQAAAAGRQSKSTRYARS